MLQAGAMRVESVSCAIGLGVQAEQLPSTSANTVWWKPSACSSSSGMGSAASSSLEQRVLRPRSVTVTATWRPVGTQAQQPPGRRWNVQMAAGVLSRACDGGRSRIQRSTWRAQWATAGWAAAISAPTALPAAGPLSSVAAAGHACSRSFPSTVRSASLMCACAAWRRGKRPAIRGLNRPRLIWWHQVPGWNPSQPGDGGPCTSPK
jgi:hypothetical protein